MSKEYKGLTVEDKIEIFSQLISNLEYHQVIEHDVLDYDFENNEDEEGDFESDFLEFRGEIEELVYEKLFNIKL